MGTELNRHAIIGSAAAALSLGMAAAAASGAFANDVVLVSPPAAPVDPEIPVVMLYDVSSGQTLYARDTERRFVPASVTKVMTVYSAFKLIDAGKLSPDAIIEVSPEVAELWSGEGSTMFLKAGDKLTVGTLLMGVTTVSANDGAAMLAQVAAGSGQAWLDMMNANAAELGMRDTHFGTPNGWPDEGRTYTSARDLAILAEAMTTRYPELYRRFFGHRGMAYRGIAQNNHDPVTGVVAGADGIKTGYTREAGYNFLGSAERNGRRLIMIVAGAPTGTARNRTSRALLEWGFDAFESRVVLQAGTPVGDARVQGGASGSVPLRTAGEVLASVPRGGGFDVSLSVRYRGPLEAPIAAGQEVATLRVRISGQQPHDVPLVAAEAVGEANQFQRLLNGIVGVFT